MAEEDKLGLGLLIPETTPSDQVLEIRDSPEEEVVVLDVDLRDALEKEIYELSIQQAEIERLAVEKGDDFDDDEKRNEWDDAGRVEIEVYNGWDEEERDVGIETPKGGDFGLEKNGGESGEEENENDEENGGGQLEKKLGRYNHVNNRRTNYPMRPDAEDCAYYMKFGSCKFGLNCKFNHPLRRKNQVVKEKGKHREENVEKAGQIECKYYLTSGGCKYGKGCKFSHGSDRSSITSNVPEFNFLGLPIRLGEKECPYYMRTGSCKFGSNCRFHHPDPTTVAGGDSQGYGNSGSLPSQLVSSSSVSSWSSPRAFNETSPFVPAMFPPTQGAPTPTPEWNGYQAATYPTSERGLPTPPAFAINNTPTELNFPMQLQHDMVIEEYPERPGEPECTFFLKTGDCKFKSNCKFHHPKVRASKAKTKAISSALNDKGLPLRPDQPICAHYHRYGICKYGPACKYDHPSKFAIMPPPYDQPSFGNSETVDGADASWKDNETGSSV